MKRCLLDTNALLWFAYQPVRLTARAKAAFRSAEELHLSIVSLWEIALKLSIGGFHDLEVPKDWQEDLAQGLQRHGIVELPIRFDHCRRLQDLPFHHRDPFDRMLIAQALEAGLAVIGSDSRFDACGVSRVW